MRLTHRLSLTLTASHCHWTFVDICHHMSADSEALELLELTAEQRAALEGSRTLVLTSSQALPDCALNCSSFFLDFRHDTVCSCKIVCHWWENKFTVYMCQFWIGQSWFRKAQRAMSAFSCVLLPLFKCDKLLHCRMLCFAGSGDLHLVTSVAQAGRWDLRTIVSGT